MNKGKTIFLVILLIIPLLTAGCQDKEKLDTIEKTQTDILAKLDIIEANQKEIAENLKNLPARAQRKRPAVDYNKVHDFPIGSSAIKGKKDAPITIVEFSDFQCTYCARLQPTLNQLLEAYPNDVKLVFKNFPLSFHKQAMNASKAAHAAGEQGKYWEMHDLLFKNFSKLTDNTYKEYAAQLKLDINKFTTDFSSNKYDALIKQDMNLGKEAGVSGTPTLFLNGKRVQKRSFDDIKTIIDGYLKKNMVR